MPGSNLLKNALDSFKTTKIAKLVTAVSNRSDASVEVGTGSTPLVNLDRGIDHVVVISDVYIIDRHVWTHIEVLISQPEYLLNVRHCQDHISIELVTDPAGYLASFVVLFLAPSIEVSEGDLHSNNRLFLNVDDIRHLLDLQACGSVPVTVVVTTRKLIINFDAKSLSPPVSVLARGCNPI